MIYIEKIREPDWLVDFKKKHPNADYSSEEFKQYREELKDVLVKEQKCLCAYCCCKIKNETSHNEHIEPQNLKSGGKSKRTLDYLNIVASCNSSKGEITCGKAKENEYDENKFVSPLNPDCENMFSYLPDGTVTGNDYTIGLLNLNAKALVEARKSLYKQLSYLDKKEIQEIYCQSEDDLYPFTNVIRYYLKEKCE